MKACPNCRGIHPDDYMGQCIDCGAPLGNVGAHGGKDLARMYARQRRRADAEAGLESTLRSGGHDSISIDAPILDAARKLLVPKPGAFTDE